MDVTAQSPTQQNSSTCRASRRSGAVNQRSETEEPAGGCGRRTLGQAGQIPSHLQAYCLSKLPSRLGLGVLEITGPHLQTQQSWRGLHGERQGPERVRVLQGCLASPHLCPQEASASTARFPLCSGDCLQPKSWRKRLGGGWHWLNLRSHCEFCP